jgi:hypothetical protein
VNEFPNAAGGEADPVLVRLHLLRDTDQHRKLHSAATAVRAA